MMFIEGLKISYNKLFYIKPSKKKKKKKKKDRLVA